MQHLGLLRPSLATLLALALGSACSEAGPPEEHAPVAKASEATAPAAKGDLAQHAKELAQRFVIADGHVDVPHRLKEGLDEKGQITEDVSKRTEKGDFDYVRAREGGLDAPFMSIYTSADLETYERKSRDRPGTSTFKGSKAAADQLIDFVEALAREHPNQFALAFTPDDVRKNFKEGKVSLPMGMENGSPLEGKLENLEHFARRGIRYITLAHSSDNHLADSSYDDRHSNGGLTDFGKQVVAEMNKLGVMVDVSHLSDDSIAQAVELSAVPVIASHSSCRHFTPGWERNISDELIQKVAAKGGVVMVNFGSTFIDDDLRKAGSARWDGWDKEKKKRIFKDAEEEAEAKKKFYEAHPLGFSTVEKAADHIEHVIKLVGVDHVGFGSDFDGVGDTLPEGLKDVSFYPNLIRVLLERGHSDEDIEKIAGKNLLRVWDAVHAHAQRMAAAQGAEGGKGG